MKYYYLILFLLIACIGFAQKRNRVDTLKVKSEIHEIYIPEKIKPTTDIKAQNDSLQKGLMEYMTSMQSKKIISDNVEITLDAEIIEDADEPALKITYSYSLKNDTLKFQTDDFDPGCYTLDASNAMLVLLQLMKTNLENEFSSYIQANQKITFTINGSADATPIKNRISYYGEYGERLSEVCDVNNTKENLLVTLEKGITSNEELAFVRSYTVRNFLENQIPTLKRTHNNFNHKAQVSELRGGRYRRVSIEIIIHNAIQNIQ